MASNGFSRSPAFLGAGMRGRAERRMPATRPIDHTTRKAANTTPPWRSAARRAWRTSTRGDRLNQRPGSVSGIRLDRRVRILIGDGRRNDRRRTGRATDMAESASNRSWVSNRRRPLPRRPHHPRRPHFPPRRDLYILRARRCPSRLPFERIVVFRVSRPLASPIYGYGGPFHKHEYPYPLPSCRSTTDRLDPDSRLSPWTGSPRRRSV